MIISNIEGEAFASFTPTYIAREQVMMTDEWVKNVDLDIMDCAKRMMIVGRQLR